MSPEEADHIIDLAEEFGFAKSDIHLDPVAKKHAKTLRSTEGNLISLAGEMGSNYSTHSAFFLEIIFLCLESMAFTCDASSNSSISVSVSKGPYQNRLKSLAKPEARLS